ncbi:hypothetical protein RsTz2092_00050 [Deferribacterales bacterium RsTz2092]|nr:hypothetical protein AGMMS49941_00460 [Deferribacterales bacterium]
MFKKVREIKVNNFPAQELTPVRLYAFDNKDVIAVSDSKEALHLMIYHSSGKVDELGIQNTFGNLVNIFIWNGAYWLEFNKPTTIYEESYTLLKASADKVEVVATFPRLSYFHDNLYHSLFIRDDVLHLNYIRHNCLHQYALDEKNNKITEVEAIRGDKWYLCGKHAICHIRNLLEFYDQELNVYNTIEYDNEIDEVRWQYESGLEALTLALTDALQEQTTLIVQHIDSNATHIAYIEYAATSMGVSGGRVWLNPAGITSENEVGGCMIYDMQLTPLYSHLRLIGKTVVPIGAYPPPFHRASQISPLVYDNTLVVADERAIIFDYSCRPAQELERTKLASVAVNPQGDIIAIMSVTEATKEVYRGITFDIYEFERDNNEGKVISMAKFKR